MGENAENVRAIYAAFGRGDIPSVLDALAEDVDWKFTGSRNHVPFAGHYRGRKGAAEFFQIVAETAEVLEFGPDEMLPCGESVIVFGHERVRAKPTGKEFRTEWVHIFTFRDGKVARLREFYDTAAMAEAYRQ